MATLTRARDSGSSWFCGADTDLRLGRAVTVFESFAYRADDSPGRGDNPQCREGAGIDHDVVVHEHFELPITAVNHGDVAAELPAQVSRHPGGVQAGESVGAVTDCDLCHGLLIDREVYASAERRAQLHAVDVAGEQRSPVLFALYRCRTAMATLDIARDSCRASYTTRSEMCDGRRGTAPNTAPSPMRATLRPGPIGLESVLTATTAASAKPPSPPSVACGTRVGGRSFMRAASRTAEATAIAPPIIAPAKRPRFPSAFPRTDPRKAPNPPSALTSAKSQNRRMRTSA
jgi:hypothetical protein